MASAALSVVRKHHHHHTDDAVAHLSTGKHDWFACDFIQLAYLLALLCDGHLGSRCVALDLQVAVEIGVVQMDGCQRVYLIRVLLLQREAPLGVRRDEHLKKSTATTTTASTHARTHAQASRRARTKKVRRVTL